MLEKIATVTVNVSEWSSVEKTTVRKSTGSGDDDGGRGQSIPSRVPIGRVGDGYLDGGTCACDWSDGIGHERCSRQTVGKVPAASPATIVAGVCGVRSIVARRSERWPERRRWWSRW